jgi:hypothetical protein
MNNAGRAVQRQQGGTIPEYKAEGGTVTDYDIPADASGNINDLIYSAMSNPSEQSYTYKPGETEDRNQNIYNFAYEGKIGLDTVPNATPFDKSIIMQAMNDAQSSSEDKPVDSDVTLEDLTNRLKVPQAEMPGPTQAPELGFYGQVPPAINPDYIQDNANVTRELLSERYSDPSRQQPATPSNIVDAMASVPNPDDLSPMNVPSSFEDNGIPMGNIMDSISSGTKSAVNYLDSIFNNTDKTSTGIPEGGDEYGDLETEKDLVSTNVSNKTKGTGEDNASALKNIMDDTENEPNPGNDNVSTKDVEDAGNDLKDQDPSMWDKAMSFIGDAFDEILDTKSLTQAAMLYLGSRALGYSHAGSINFVGKNYAQQIGNKLKVADKATLSNKYTKDSVEKYRKSGNLKDLELVKNVQLEDTLSMVDRQTGRSIIVNKYKDANTGKISYMTPDGKPIDMSTGRLISESDETSRSKRFMSTATGAYEAELSKLPDEIQSQFRERLPSGEAIGLEAYNKARELGLDESKIASIIPTIFRQMRNDLGDDSINETAFESYLNKQLINLSLKDYDIKSNFDKVPAKITDSINNKVRQNVPGTDSLVGISEFYRKAHDKYKDLEDSDKAKYKDNLTTGMTPFLVFVEMELDKLSNK